MVTGRGGRRGGVWWVGDGEEEGIEAMRKGEGGLQ